MRTPRQTRWSSHVMLRVPWGPTWFRGPATFDGDEIVLDIERAEPYDLSEAPPGVVFDLAAIREPADALGFVRRWGLLWMGQEDRDPREFGEPLLDEESCREPFDNWATVALNLSSVLARAALARLGREDNPASRQELAHYWMRAYAGLGWQGNASNEVTEEDAAEFGRIESVARWWETWDRDSMLYDLRTELAEDAAGLLAEVDIAFHLLATDELDFEGRGEFPTDFVINARVPHLEALAYYELMLEVTGGSEMRICPEDGRIFPVRDSRQRYCTPQCAGRARYRRFADRKRQSPK